MTGKGVLSIRDSGWAALVTLMVFIGYVQTSSTVVPASGDGYREWMRVIGPAEPRPNHLELTGLFRLASAALAASPLHLSPVRSMAVVNSLAGALGAGLWFLVARRKGVGRGVAALGALLFAFSFSYWYHSREPETAMVAELFFLAAIALADRASSLEGRARWVSAALAGAAFGLTVLLALNLVVFAPMFLWLLIARGAKGERVRALLAFGAAALLVSAPPFLTRYEEATGAAPAGLLAWVLHHPASEMMGSVPRGVSILTIARALAGMGRGLLGPGGDAPSVIKLWLLKRPVPELDPAAVVLFALASGLGLLLLAMTWKTSWRERHGDPFWMALGIGTICGLIAAVNWLGSDPQFWLPIYPLLFWAGIRGLDSLARPSRRRPMLVLLSGTVLLFFVANLPWPVPTPSQPRGGAEWRAARRFAQTLRSGDLYLSLQSLWSFYVAESSPRVRQVSLLLDVPGTGPAYVDRITGMIDSTLARGHAAYAEGLDRRLSIALEGEWENVESVHRVERSVLLAALRNRYQLVSPPESGAGLMQLRGGTARATP